ncbi:MAG: WG repeat-containing protein [Pseudomonadales bacterium]|jgi:hypothetical protein|nr:WG repeat-containing protein [Pseudomonadales bacterium]
MGDSSPGVDCHPSWALTNPGSEKNKGVIIMQKPAKIGDGLWSFVNTAGERDVIDIVRPFKWAGHFSRGFAPVQFDDNLYGYINENGEDAFEGQKFLHASPFREDDLAIVTRLKFEHTMGINTKGEMIQLPCEPSTPPLLAKPLAKSESGRFTFVKALNCERAFEVDFIDALPFNDGLAPVKLDNGLWSFITMTGERAFDAEFKWARIFTCGLACVQFSSGNYGFITKTGKKAFDAEYRSDGIFIDGLAHIMSIDTDKMVTINRKGYVVSNAA